MNEEKLLREFIAALEKLNDVYIDELGVPATDDGNASAENCDTISAYGFDTYDVKDKLVELKLRLWSLIA